LLSTLRLFKLQTLNYSTTSSAEDFGFAHHGSKRFRFFFGVQ
jgi:hypothetical protein